MGAQSWLVPLTHEQRCSKAEADANARHFPWVGGHWGAWCYGLGDSNEHANHGHPLVVQSGGHAAFSDVSNLPSPNADAIAAMGRVQYLPT